MTTKRRPPTKLIMFLEKFLLLAKYYYYNSDSPILTDQEYDQIEDWLKDMLPEHPFLEVVGGGINYVPLTLEQTEKLIEQRYKKKQEIENVDNE